MLRLFKVFGGFCQSLIESIIYSIKSNDALRMNVELDRAPHEHYQKIPNQREFLFLVENVLDIPP